MPGLVPGIHVFGASENKSWMAGTKPGRDGKQKPAPKTMPFDCEGIGWQAAHAALLLISNESFCVDAHAAS